MIWENYFWHHGVSMNARGQMMIPTLKGREQNSMIYLKGKTCGSSANIDLFIDPNGESAGNLPEVLIYSLIDFAGR